MKSAVQHAEATRSQPFPTAQAGIKMTPEMADALSSKVYSDVISAILREIGTNGWDEHRRLGIERPIRVQLPTLIRPEVRIRDFGEGLNDRDLLVMYLTYGESTKQNTNTQAGKFGVGSKSPFAYIAPSGQFQVVSRHRGRRITAVGYYDKGLPSLSILSDVEMGPGEETGLEIIIPVKREDLDKWHVKAQSTFQWFDPLPEVTGTDRAVSPPKYIVRGANWGLRDYVLSSTTALQIVQGCVAYRVESRDLTNDHAERQFLSLGLDIYVEMGEVEPALSREYLNLDNRTVTNIQRYVEVVKKELRAEIERELNTKPTFWEAIKWVHNTFNRAGYHAKELLTKDLAWRGTVIRQQLTINAEADNGSTIVYLPKYKQTRAKWMLESHKKFSLAPADDIKVYWDDTSIKNIRPILAFNEKGAHNLVILRTDSPELRDKYLAQIGNPPWTKITDLPKPPKELMERKRTKTPKLKVYTINGWEQSGHDFEEGGFYVQLFRDEVMTPGGKRWVGFHDVLGAARAAGLFRGYVYGVPASHKTSTLGRPQWVMLWDHLHTIAKEILKQHDVAKMWHEWMTLRDFENSDIGLLLQRISRVQSPKKKNGTLGLYLLGYEHATEAVKEHTTKLSLASTVGFLESLGYSMVPKTKTFELDASRIKETLQHRYPLIRLMLSNSRADDTDVGNFVDYVDMIDAE